MGMIACESKMPQAAFFSLSTDAGNTKKLFLEPHIILVIVYQ